MHRKTMERLKAEVGMPRDLFDIVNESHRFMAKCADGVGWEGAARLVREAFVAGMLAAKETLE